MTDASLLVIGRKGQMARALQARAAARGVALVASGRPEVDLRHADGLARLLDRVSPACVINTAAYTNVDGAESDVESCRSVNADGPGKLARACATRGLPLIHMSTDCVFDGRLDRPYRETDTPAPLGVYGRSKLDGEQAVAAAHERHLIVRVCWIYSHWAGNFVKTMLRLADTRERVTVVNDQVGHPTHAGDLADGLLSIAAAATRPDFAGWGLYHLAGREPRDRAGQARDIFAASQALGGPVAEVDGVPSTDYPTPARRPPNARLASDRAEAAFGLRLAGWSERVQATVAACLAERHPEEGATP